MIKGCGLSGKSSYKIISTLSEVYIYLYIYIVEKGRGRELWMGDDVQGWMGGKFRWRSWVDSWVRLVGSKNYIYIYLGWEWGSGGEKGLERQCGCMIEML